ncbi:hypothetical protein NXS19_004781 [Fusarium pseudograminearum]|nr:hypothetical protein NXS19_004781 [Fusarium pseudograminearum]
MGGRPEDMCAIARTHSDMVKSGPHDDEYRKFANKISFAIDKALREEGKRAAAAIVVEMITGGDGLLSDGH